ncbi:MAG: hypothetical protein K6T63_04810, partial [Alicyclobacillus herbarius]|uniref:MutS-related protein n=1 Tax=Alicyclobacillus herbarius TaxID=122960 RepID=UPI002356CBBB
MRDAQGASTEFLDPPSARQLDWPGWLSALRPVSVYGQAAKGRLRPFLPGEEDAFTDHFARLKSDIAFLSEEAIRHLRGLLADLPDIRPLLGLGAPPGMRGWLALKRFACLGRQAATVYREAGGSAHVGTETAWTALAEALGRPDTPSFAWAHAAGDGYLQLANRHRERVRALAAARRARDEAWLAETGTRPDREGRVTVPLPASWQLAQTLKRRAETAGDVQWVRDTPFESVFVLEPSPRMRELGASAEQVEQELAAAEEAVKERLWRNLCARVADWRRAIDWTAQLDLQVARVVLAREWQAAVPELADDGCISIVGGRSPQLTERLEAIGLAFEPLDWRLTGRVQVLCGSNMGGKTVALTLLAGVQALAQYGLPVPTVAFRTRLFRGIRTHLVESAPEAGLVSSFAHEVLRMGDVWHAASQPGPWLVVLDEPWRSTDPQAGEALAVAVLS